MRYGFLWFAITVGASITLTILLLTGVLNFTAYQVIPVGGMVISGAMVAIGLCYRQMLSNFELRKQEVEIKLALGSTPKQASKAIVRDVIKTGLQPTVDSAKTLGYRSAAGDDDRSNIGGYASFRSCKISNDRYIYVVIHYINFLFYYVSISL